MLNSESFKTKTRTEEATRGARCLLQPEQARKIKQNFQSLKFTFNLGEELEAQAHQKTIFVSLTQTSKTC